MKIAAFAAALAGLAILSACGGGGGGSTGASAASGLPATISVTLSASSGSASATEGATGVSQTVTATATTTGNLTTPVVADLSYDKTVYASVTAVAGTTSGTYTVTLTPLANLHGGTYASPVTFRLCQDTACTQVYAGTTVTYNFALTVVHDWTTFQGDAAHTGYVHLTLDPSKFVKAWTFVEPDGDPVTPVIAGGGAAFFSVGTGNKLYSLDEATGAVNWVRNIYADAKAAYPGSAAYANGKIYVPVGDFSQPIGGFGAFWVVDAVTGKTITTWSFQTQLGDPFASPVLQGGDLFWKNGYFGETTYRYALPSGTQVWQTVSPSGAEGAINMQESSAVDDKYVYYYNYQNVSIYNRADGTLYAQVGDPSTFTTIYSGYEAPVITASGHVVVSGNWSQVHTVMAIDPPTKSVAWRSTNNYLLQPAAAGSVIYAGRVSATDSRYATSMDALSDADGSLLWSWTMPATDTQLIENPIVCDNLLFVSTDKATYAVDLTTHQTVWSTPLHGRLSLSAGGVLYISTSDYGVAGTVTAVKLR